ncbi:hypothetical protein C8J57DRAFT_1257334 [Mycena rebaudengoi]|nr:hypothetical protein C8J57DRAFT_1257334 [Mycena rebaudengoi]
MQAELNERARASRAKYREHKKSADVDEQETPTSESECRSESNIDIVNWNRGVDRPTASLPAPSSSHSGSSRETSQPIERRPACYTPPNTYPLPDTDPEFEELYGAYAVRTLPRMDPRLVRRRVLFSRARTDGARSCFRLLTTMAENPEGVEPEIAEMIEAAFAEVEYVVDGSPKIVEGHDNAIKIKTILLHRFGAHTSDVKDEVQHDLSIYLLSHVNFYTSKNAEKAFESPDVTGGRPWAARTRTSSICTNPAARLLSTAQSLALPGHPYLE